MKNFIYYLLATALLYGCGNTQIDIPLNADVHFKPFLSSYTSGVISKSDDIHIVFKENLSDSILEDTSNLYSAISLEPKIDYRIKSMSKKHIVITPSIPLRSGTRYRANVNIAKLINKELEHSIFPLVFETKIQDYAIQDLKSEIKDIYKPNEIVISGFIVTTDNSALENAKNTLVSVGDLDIEDVQWIAYSDRKFQFTLPKIMKQLTATSLTLEFNGNTFNLDHNENPTIDIAAISDFKMNKWEYTSYPDQVLTLEFSEPLKPNQNLEGLIQLDAIKNFTYETDKNTVKLFLKNSFTGTTRLVINQGIRAFSGNKIKTSQETEVTIKRPMATVEMIGEGNILPNSQGLIVPFKTIGLKKIDVDIFKIHEKNILQFLQVNEISENSQMRRVAEKIKTHTINLASTNARKLKQWTTHGVNLRDIINPEPGAIYRVRFSFKQAYTFCECDNNINKSTYSDYHDYYENSNYTNREHYDECDEYFYYYSTKSKNLLASDLGLIVKSGNDKKFDISTTNLIHGNAEAYTSLKFYNYSQSLISSVSTDDRGFASIRLKENPYAVIASNGPHKAYLKLGRNQSNSLSKFETQGVMRSAGIDAFFYGERGVWRPGDDIHLSCVIRDEFNKMRDGQPLKLSFTNPNGQLVSNKTLKLTTSGIHSVLLKTDANAPTGNYQVKLQGGSHTFYKTLKIETIRPNRLKIILKTENEEILSSEEELKLNSAWLHGAKAGGLKASVVLKLSPMATRFDKHKSYDFQDVAKRFSTSEKVIFNSKLDSDGNADIKLPAVKVKSSGKLKASFITKVFEKGGGFSIDQFSTTYHPYKSYVGMDLPISNSGYLRTNTSNGIDLVHVNTTGNLITSPSQLKVKVYKIEWRWWWQHNEEDLASYIKNNSYDLLEEKTIKTVNGRASYKLNIPEHKWGQYYIQVTDINSGHSSGTSFFADYYGSNRNQKQQNNALLLKMKMEKEKYEVGEFADLTFPSNEGGRALVSIENDIEVLQKFWVSTKSKQTTVSLALDNSMSPNCYAHVTVLQPHIHNKNEKPIRMYGVVPITVFDKNSVLEPRIAMKPEIRPEQNNMLTVSEKSGKGMHYTVAIVDDGLLDLTRFQTPDIWENFNKKRALGINTWDVYDDVINAFSGKFDNVYSIGGDAAGVEGNIAKANRFQSVVKYLGPFYLEPGEQARHTFKIENYVGSVRAMVVCRNGNSFGKAEYTAKVKKPLMIQANAPRVLTPGDELSIPVTIFANEKARMPITLTIQGDDHVTIDQNSLKISEVSNGESLHFIKVKINEKLGNTTLKIIAKCANDQHTQTLQIPIRKPGFEIHKIQDKTLKAGESHSFSFDRIGWNGTNSAVVEVSQYPSINLDKRLGYLIRYPHGCIEQTTSSVFPQLFLSQITELTNKKEKNIETNIKNGITRIGKFTTLEGGFSYWPGHATATEWGSNYAGHFLLEAKAQGYYVNKQMLANWHSFQSKKANEYRNSSTYKYHSNELTQAYRLYTMALYGKADIGAMNRMKEYGITSNTAKWRLASAYAIAGQKHVAQSIVASVSYDVADYRDHYYTYGSSFRDQSIILECMHLIGESDRQITLMKKLAKRLGSESWMSTQETAYGLIAFAKIIENTTGKMASYTIRVNGKTKSATFDGALSQQDYGTVKSSNQCSVKNIGGQTLFVRVINKGTPPSTTLKDEENKLKLTVNYTDLDGKSVDIKELTFGKDYKVNINVKSLIPSDKIDNISLSTYFPSGCEIINERMDGSASSNTSADYEDIRDDVIHTYFSLRPLQSMNFSYTFTSSFKGKYLHPGIYTEAMYDASINARKGGIMIAIE
ncbi:MAG: hypothetical protein ACI80H_000607 [Pseudoalteromonas distincta]|jgi:uncharacterized protein YfaS (alpha-2-macroglobulin family)